MKYKDTAVEVGGIFLLMGGAPYHVIDLEPPDHVWLQRDRFLHDANGWPVLDEQGNLIQNAEHRVNLSLLVRLQASYVAPRPPLNADPLADLLAGAGETRQ